MLIAHLSDPHLRAQGDLYQGLVDSNAMFDQAIETLTALDPAPDIVIISGDLVDHGQEEEYETVKKALCRLRQPVFAIPGNHDNRQAFKGCFAPTGQFDPTKISALQDNSPAHFVARNDAWPVQIIGFDITVPDHHHGDMDDAACAWLRQTLAERPDLPTILMMHQPPVDCGIACIDAYKCRQGDRLAEIVSAHNNIERILCGHIHRFMQMRFANTILMTAPSTTTAIALRLHPDAEPASCVEPPALLLHHWTAQYGLISHHVPIGEFPGPYAFF